MAIRSFVRAHFRAPLIFTVAGAMFAEWNQMSDLKLSGQGSIIGFVLIEILFLSSGFIFLYEQKWSFRRYWWLPLLLPLSIASVMYGPIKDRIIRESAVNVTPVVAHDITDSVLLRMHEIVRNDHITDKARTDLLCLEARKVLSQSGNQSGKQQIISYLGHLHFSGLDLHGLDGLGGLNFRDLYFEKATFDDSDLFGADFRTVHADGSHFEKAKINRADFSGAHLEGATFTGVVGLNADFTNARLVGAHFDGEVELNGARFSNAELSDSIFPKARLKGSVMAYANCTRSIFAESDLRHSDLRGTDFDHADLRMVNFMNSVLSNRDLGTSVSYLQPLVRKLGEKNTHIEPAEEDCLEKKCCNEEMCVFSSTTHFDASMLSDAIWQNGQTCGTDSPRGRCKLPSGLLMPTPRIVSQ